MDGESKASNKTKTGVTDVLQHLSACSLREFPHGEGTCTTLKVPPT